MAAGFIWGLPGARGRRWARWSTYSAGGRTQVSGAIRAAILLALVLGLGEITWSRSPHAVLAGILMKVGWDIIDWRFLTRIHRVQREHLVVMLITLGLTVFLDLVTAVAIGMIAAGMASARQFRAGWSSTAWYPCPCWTRPSSRAHDGRGRDRRFSPPASAWSPSGAASPSRHPSS